MLIKKGKPRFPDELPIREEAPDVSLGAAPHKAQQVREALLMRAASPMGEQCPHQRQTEAVPDCREQQDIDILLAQFPIGAVQDQVQLAVWEGEQREADKEMVWKLEADKTPQPLVPRVEGAGQVHMSLQRVQHDTAGLHHGQDQRRQDLKTAAVKRKRTPQRGLQAVVWVSAPGFQRRNTLLEPTFFMPSRVLTGSQPKASSDIAQLERVFTPIAANERSIT